jgi:retron-type reverse transcriptase
MRKVWKETQSGREWIVDADLKDFFGSVEHEKLLTLVAQRNSRWPSAASDRSNAQGQKL